MSVVWAIALLISLSVCNGIFAITTWHKLPLEELVDEQSGECPLIVTMPIMGSVLQSICSECTKYLWKTDPQIAQKCKAECFDNEQLKRCFELVGLHKKRNQVEKLSPTIIRSINNHDDVPARSLPLGS